MSTTTDTSADAAAIKALHSSFQAQKAGFLRDPSPSAETRRNRVLAVATMTLENRLRIREAVVEDFGSHPALFADMVETLGVAGRAAFAAERLEEWMAPEPRDADPGMFGSGRAEMRLEPKGVVGNMVPWNFPYDLSLGPLVDMLAAGNRVIIKPSDFTPACAELLRAMIGATFDPDLVDVAVGGIELAREFPRLRWDHLLYTGSPNVGRQVAQLAAENLVPITLELGGKCPAIVLDDAVEPRSVEHIVGIKMIKNGQMCNTVDHCLVPRARVQDFVDLAVEWVGRAVPAYSATSDCTGSSAPRTSTGCSACSTRPARRAPRSYSSTRGARSTATPGACRCTSSWTRRRRSASLRKRSSGRSSRCTPTTRSTRRSRA